MATGALLPAGYETLQDSSGVTIPGGLIWTYVAGTTTPQATYKDSALAVVNTNPIIADGAGRWTAYVPAGTSYKLVYETPAIPPAHGTVILTVDNLSGPVFTGQLQFPAVQVPSSDPNVLDDYEEGIWTPVIGGAGGQSGQTYFSTTGQYTKVGRLVHIQFDSQLTAKGTITGGVVISGLPFSCQNNCSGAMSYFVNLAVAKVWLTVLGQGFAITLCGLNAAGTNTPQLLTADIANNTQLVGSMTYMTTQ